MALLKVWDSVLGWTNINISHKHYKADILDFSHSLLEHTVSGLTTGHVLQATSSTTYGFASLPSHMHTKAQISDFAHAHDISSIGNGSYSRAGTLTPIKQSLFDFARGNRFSFINPSVVTLECTDNGVDWTNYGATDEQIIRFFSGIDTPIYIGKNTSSLTGYTANSKTRITIDAEGSGTYFGDWYTTLILVCTNGSVGLNVTIEASTVANPNKFTTIVSSVPLSGWSGPNEIGHPSLTFGTSFPEQHRKVRFIFGIDSIGGYSRAEIWQLRAYSYSVWAGTSNMMYNDHLYSWDAYQNTYFPNKVYTANGVLEAVTKNSSNNSLDEPLNLKYNQWYEDDINAYGLNCNNSDIIGANGIYFADSTDGPGEGINFINSNDSTKYDTIYTYNNKLYFHSLRTRGEGLSGSLVLTSADAYTKTQVDNELYNKVFLKSNTDNRAVATIPNDYNGKFEIKGLKENPILGLSVELESYYSGLLGMRSWDNSSGGNAHEFALTGNGNIFHRHGATTTWNSWRKIAYKDEIPIVPAWALKPSLDIDDIPTIPHTKLSGVINYQNLEAILSDYRTAVVADNLYATKDELNNRVPIEIKGTYNLNNLLSVGFYTINGNMNVTNAPVTGAYSVIVTRSANGNYFHQMIIQDGTYNIYLRYYNGSTWSSWKKLLYDDEKAYDTTRVDGREVKYYTQSQFDSITPVAGVHYVIYEN